MHARSTCLVFAIAACSVGLLRCGSSADIPALMGADLDGGSEAATPATETPPTGTGTTDASSDGAPTVDTPDGSGGITNDGGPGGTTATLACGGTACALPTQSCCIERLGGGAASYACVTGSSCSAGNGGNQDPPTALQCSGAANCGPGTVCCISRTGDAISSACKATCSGGDTAQLCDKTAATTGCPVDAGSLSTCSSKDIGDWGLPSAFATCGGRGN